LENVEQPQEIRSLNSMRGASDSWMYDFCVKMQVRSSIEPAENLMANILNSSKSKLCMKGVDFLLFSCNNVFPSCWGGGRNGGGRRKLITGKHSSEHRSKVRSHQVCVGR
jgi:hypothetical protein